MNRCCDENCRIFGQIFCVYNRDVIVSTISIVSVLCRTEHIDCCRIS